MKKAWTILAGAAFLVASLGIGEATAAHRAGSTDFSLMLGGHNFEGDQNIEDDWTFGLGVGHNYTENLGIELTVNYTPTEADGLANFDVDAWVYKADLLYNFPIETMFPDLELPYVSDIVPYVAAGLGGVTIDPDRGGSETDFLVNYGAGVKLFVTENVAIRGDIRHLYVFDDPDHNLLFSAGLMYQLGGAAPAPVPRAAAPTDSDNDGVPDSEDRCPGTAPGTMVDRLGCPEKPAPAAAAATIQDSDGDGVPDSRDECPDTSKGVMVDEDGCPLSMEVHIEFPFDSAEIPAVYEDELKKAARFIKENPAPKILIAGHTDSIGEAEYNQKLSERRAAAVRQYLIDNYGISSEKLVSRGYGESRPIATNETPAGRQQNRRTEIICCVVIPED